MQQIKDKIPGVVVMTDFVIIYHKGRKVFRLFDQSRRSKWNKVLRYCQKSLEYAASDEMIARTLNDYEKNQALYAIFYTNNIDELEIRSMDDMYNHYPELFI